MCIGAWCNSGTWIAMVGDEYARSVFAALRETTDDQEEIEVLESALNDGVV